MDGRYMIRCDIEGVSGVVSYDQAEPGAPEYAFGLRMFESDLRACIDGLFDGGAVEIVIYDEHYYGRNIDPEMLPDGVSAVCGKPPYRADWAGGLDETFDGLVLLGFHSKFGTPGGLLHHSYELDIRDLRLGGVSVGEIGMEIAVAGDFGVPAVLVTADSAGAAEAEALVPGVRCVSVKESLGETGGRCFPAETTRKAIRTAAASVVNDPPDVTPWTLDAPVRLEVELNDGDYLDAVRKLLSDEMEGDRVLVIEGETATAVWADYWAKKLRCQEEAAS